VHINVTITCIYIRIVIIKQRWRIWVTYNLVSQPWFVALKLVGCNSPARVDRRTSAHISINQIGWHVAVIIDFAIIKFPKRQCNG